MTNRRGGTLRHASALAFLLGSVGLMACEAEPDALQPGAPVFVDSDPRGADIWLDDGTVGGLTPDTVQDITVGTHVMGVSLDTVGLQYSFFDQVSVPSDSVLSLRWPLLARCQRISCLELATATHSAAGLDFDVAPNGSLFFSSAGDGIIFPRGSGNGYASGGAAILAGFLGDFQQSVGAAIYDLVWYAGRPVERVQQGGGAFELRLENWIVPPPQAQVVPSTARGISIDHTISADEAHTGVLLIRLVYRNLTADSLYLAIDRPLRDNAPNQTYRTAYAGLALDVDVGDAGDDFIGYVPDQDLAFVYDSDFLEAGFDVFSESPALVGVRMLEAPAGTDIILTGWPGEWDWDGATSQEQLAWLFASGTHEEDVIPNHADPRIGYMPAVPADIRLLVTAGPIDLAPGDSAVVRLAVAIADPVAGSYTSGTAVEPGDPFDPDRPILDIAADLIQRAVSAGQ